MSDTTDEVGVVVIGRNEGERLRRCLRSVLTLVPRVVYVDSGSTDGSVAHARGLGIEVVELDLSVPFTMARGRNTGLGRLKELWPRLAYVQFVDGDCEVREGWIDRARQELDGDAELAVVFGRRRERHPEASVYNRVCDIEWDVPVGDADSCGGDAMMRVDALDEVGAFDAGLIAGEEPELCVRLRKAGWRVRRIDCEMTLHDAALLRLGQWWTRSVRAGYSYAEGFAMHGGRPWRHRLRELRSVLFWGGAVPGLALALAIGSVWLPALGLGLLGVAALYAWLGVRVYRDGRRHAQTPRHATVYSALTVLAKLPLLWGALRYAALRLRGRRSRLIEYK